MFFFLLYLLGGLRLNLLIVIFIIVTVLIGGVLPLIERKFLSLIQRRVGPSVVGYRGRLQFVADALKLFLKEVIIIKKVNVWNFSALPFLFFVTNLLALAFVTWDRCGSALIGVEYTIPALLVFFSICNLLVIFTGLNLKNKYTTLSSRRAGMIAINFDIVVTAAILIVVLLFNHFSTTQINLLTSDYPGLMFFLPILLIVLFLFLMDVGRAPFDLVEAESELIMGFHSEYSSFLFALFILGEYVHIYMFSYLTAVLLLV